LRDEPKTRFTWKHWAVIIPALIVGVSISLAYEYWKSGAISSDNLFTSALALAVGIAFAVIISRRANKPDSKDPP
jgi:hypothetical protein